MSDEQDQLCPKCGHRWAAHHTHPDWGFGIKGKCLYHAFADSPDCPCLEPNPKHRREADHAKAMWDMTMGRADR